MSVSLENFLRPVQLREDEYLDEETKLIYCSRCRTARQKRFELPDRLFEPRCMCACEAEAYEQREKERKQREFLSRVAKNRSVGLPDPELRKHTFENDLGYNPKQMNMAKRFVENWSEFQKNSMGLLLWGDVGTGKSFLAGCIANALLDKGVPVMMTNFARLLNRLTDMYSGDRNAYVDSFHSFPLLIIDDLGVERNSEFAREQVFHIIDSRYRSQLPMIVTTNLTMEELKNPADLARARIYDRVLERCTPIRVNDQNIRNLNTNANMARAKQLLGR
ncbi:MAG: ATP-binding protein [Oscillospiraceae bacterium]|nr:ATP-binding protein [Oscillospiraceae bacterium]